MKFHKVIKELQENPEALFRSDQACCECQDLTSITYWLTHDDNSMQERQSTLERFLKATDWEKQNDIPT